MHEQESRILGQIANLKRNKPKNSKYNKKELEIRNLSSEKQVTKINDQMRLLQDAKEGYCEALDQLISERGRYAFSLQQQLVAVYLVCGEIKMGCCECV